MNMQSLMQQAQKMQRDLQKAKDELSKMEFLGTNGGAVTVTIFGNRTVKSVQIDSSILTPDDAEMLSEMINKKGSKIIINVSMPYFTGIFFIVF